jgi:type IV pilus assembly protein PilC
MYPIAVLLVAMGILVLILVWVVPVFEDVFQSLGAPLPWSTQVVVSWRLSFYTQGIEAVTQGTP